MAGVRLASAPRQEHRHRAGACGLDPLAHEARIVGRPQGDCPRRAPPGGRRRRRGSRAARRGLVDPQNRQAAVEGTVGPTPVAGDVGAGSGRAGGDRRRTGRGGRAVDRLDAGILQPLQPCGRSAAAGAPRHASRTAMRMGGRQHDIPVGQPAARPHAAAHGLVESQHVGGHERGVVDDDGAYLNCIHARRPPAGCGRRNPPWRGRAARRDVDPVDAGAQGLSPQRRRARRRRSSPRS